MPLVDLINGIKILIYNGEHRPPHIHARYNEYEVLITIETQDLYAGEMPGRQLKTIFDWLASNSE
jgi:hypothetical protein